MPHHNWHSRERNHCSQFGAQKVRTITGYSSQCEFHFFHYVLGIRVSNRKPRYSVSIGTAEDSRKQ